MSSKTPPPKRYPLGIDPDSVLEEWDDCFILRDGVVVPKETKHTRKAVADGPAQPADASNTRSGSPGPLGGDADPANIDPFPEPPAEDADQLVWGDWLIRFLQAFVDAWAGFEKTFKSYSDDDWETGQPPDVLREDAPRLLTDAAGAVQGFRSVWVFRSRTEPDGLSGILRDTRDYIKAGDYSDVDLDRLKEYVRDFEDAIDRSRGAEGRQSEPRPTEAEPAGPKRQGNSGEHSTSKKKRRRQRAPKHTEKDLIQAREDAIANVTPPAEPPTSQLPRAPRLAMQAYGLALARMEANRPTDKEVYAWLEDHIRDLEPLHEDGTYELPSQAAFFRALGRARKHEGAQKNQPRRGRDLGPSITRADNIETHPPE